MRVRFYQSIISGYDIENIDNMAWQSAEIYPSRLHVNDVSNKSLERQWQLEIIMMQF